MEEDFIRGLVSVIIPTHNRADLIGETIDSVCNQTYKQIEIIIVDDHSDDNTVFVVRNYCIEKDNVIFIKSNSSGACSARNEGIKISKGEFLQFFDDDDIMAPTHIEDKVNTIMKYNADYVSCDFIFFRDNIENVVGNKKVSSCYHNAVSHFLTKNLPTPAFMIRRNTQKRIGFWNEKILKMQDFAYFHRLFLFELKGVFLTKYLFCVRLHKNSMTHYTINHYKGYENIFNAYNIVLDEWESNKKNKMCSEEIEALVLLKLTIAKAVCSKNLPFRGMMFLFRTVLHNPHVCLKLLLYIIDNRSFDLTRYLINKSTNYGKSNGFNVNV